MEHDKKYHTICISSFLKSLQILKLRLKELNKMLTFRFKKNLEIQNATRMSDKK